MPRQLKLTPKLQEKIIGYLRAGAYVETAAAAAGIEKKTFYNWLKRAAEGEEPFAAFAEAVEEAQALAEVRDIAIVGKAAESQWQAAAWRLERKFPERWGRRDKHEVTGADGGPIQHTHDADALLARINTLAAQCAPGTSGDATSAGLAEDDTGGPPSGIK